MDKNTDRKQSGFAALEIIVVVLVLAILGFVAWRVIGSKQQAKSMQTVAGPLTQEDRQRLADTGEETAKTVDQPDANSNSGSSSSGNTSGNAASKPKSSTTSSSGNTNTTTTTDTSTTPAATPPTQSTPTVPSNNFTRPTTAFCQEKNGNTFTNAWVTDNSSHTYQVWENGGWVNKTETGTAGRNYDTMSVVGVIPYARQSEWASCSDKAGYIMFYYKPTGSVYTYNWLVPFEHISTTKP
jgi:hypothetical protein